MTSKLPIICKPTRWFTFRAMAMFLMFGFFAVYFYYDGSVGYRKKNEAFYLNKTFHAANAEFSRMNAESGLTPQMWKDHAAKQNVRFPEDRSLLPADIKLPMAWPSILHDFDRMKSLQTNLLWREYTGSRGMDQSVKEKPYDAREIGEQWVVFWICLTLALGALFLLLRTMRRSLIAEEEFLITQQGKRIPYSDLKLLDLRKWDTKGIALAEYAGSSGEGKVRIDGLTYGGFRKEDGEPAECLMRQIRSRFSGEIIEYAPVNKADESAAAASSE
jgi:hypothetical protein